MPHQLLRWLPQAFALVASVFGTVALTSCVISAKSGTRMEQVQVADSGRSFILTPSANPFTPFGFNYDHDRDGRLLEDYWDREWDSVASDFKEMKDLGANVVRVHLQFGKFMHSPTEPEPTSLALLRRLVHLAERTGLHLDVTGLGCYHKQDVPGWYDALDEEQRWSAQARFWEAVANTCKDSPAIFCYDLMNEPVSPASKSKSGDWLGPGFAGKHFVQWISLDPRGRPAPEIALAWIKQLAAAIRKQDSRHLITVGLVPWSLDRPGLRSGFVPTKVSTPLDFIAVHLYPESNKLDEAIVTLRGFSVGKPVIIEEFFPLKCNPAELAEFVSRSREVAAGHIGFYWGKTPSELGDSKIFQDALIRAWLEYFEGEAKRLRQSETPARR